MNAPAKARTQPYSNFSQSPAENYGRDFFPAIGGPMAEAVSKIGAERRTALEREVCARWQPLVTDGALPLEVGMTTASARK